MEQSRCFGPCLGRARNNVEVISKVFECIAARTTQGRAYEQSV
jgi:hypothetical protein